MKYFSSIIIILFFIFPHVVFAQTAVVTPTVFFCVGNNPQPPCATIPPTQPDSISQSPTVAPTAISGNPTISTQPATSVSPTSNPCATGQSSVSASAVKTHHHKNGAISQFIQFLLQLLLDLLKLLFGGGIPEIGNPQPTPNLPTSQPTISVPAPTIITPAISIAPTTNPCVTPTTIQLSPTPTIISASPTPPSSGSFLAVNYSPAKNGGYDEWIHYNGATIRSDFAKIRSFGFNGVRIGVPAETGAFDFPSPTATELANLKDMYTAAKENGLQLQLMMFDFNQGKWGLIGGSRTWITAVVGALKTVDPHLGGIYELETHNEILTGSNYNQTYVSGYDSGWPTGIAKPTFVWDVAMVWVREMTYEFRSLAPGIPVTTSIPSGQGTTTPGHNGLQYYYNASHGTDWQPDWYDYHLYGSPNTILSQLQQALSIVGGDPKMLHIGEFGFNINGTSPTAAQRTTAAQYAQNARYYAHQLGLSEPQWWMFYDLAPDAQFTTGQSDGLVDVTGADTPAGTVYRQYPPGSVPPRAP